MNQQVNLVSNGDYWKVSYYDEHGRRRFHSLGSKKKATKRRAKQLAEEFRSTLAQTPQIRNTGKAPRLQEWITLYLERRTDLSPSTMELHADTCKRLIKFFGEGRRMDKITRNGAADWQAWLAKQRDLRYGKKKLKKGEKPPTPPPLSEATVCRHIRNAKVVFKHAMKVDLIVMNPFDRLQGKPSAPDKTWTQLSEKHIEKLLEVCSSPGWKAMIGLCAYAGLRRGEAIRLNWGDVQWEKSRLIVRNAAGSVSTKSKTREVLLVPALEKLLLDAHDLPDTANPTDGVGHNNMFTVMQRTIKRAGYEVWSSPFHTLRKWRATSWRDEYPEHVVDAWLGHSLDVSRKHYVTVNESYYSNGESKDDKIARLEKEIAAMHEKSKK